MYMIAFLIVYDSTSGFRHLVSCIWNDMLHIGKITITKVDPTIDRWVGFGIFVLTVLKSDIVVSAFVPSLNSRGLPQAK